MPRTYRCIDELLTGNIAKGDPGIGNSSQSLTRFQLEGCGSVREQSRGLLQIGRYRHILGELSIDARCHRAGRIEEARALQLDQELARLTMTATIRRLSGSAIATTNAIRRCPTRQ